MSSDRPSLPDPSAASPSLQSLSIFLVGMMGCGKSTVGRALARQLSYRFFDADILIERVAGQTIPEIFATQGEAEFRAIESKVLTELCACTQSVIATGGGVVMPQQNWRYLRQGLVVWLDASFEVLWQRLRNDTRRPLLQRDEPAAVLRQLLQERRDRYAQADLRITVSNEVPATAIAAQIVDRIPSVLKTLSPPTQPEAN